MRFMVLGQATIATLLYLDCDIAFPSPALAKAGDGAVHGEQPLWPDHAFEIAGTASLHRLVQLIAAAEDRAPEGREHEHCSTTGDHWLGRLARLA